MKDYYVVSGDHVEKVTLRETPKFFIDGKANRKFKKSENNEYLAYYKHNGGAWHSSSYYVYSIDHEKPLQIVEKNKRSMFTWKVKRKAEAKILELKTYSEFVEINKLLNLGVEL